MFIDKFRTEMLSKREEIAHTFFANWPKNKHSPCGQLSRQRYLFFSFLFSLFFFSSCFGFFCALYYNILFSYCLVRVILILFFLILLSYYHGDYNLIFNNVFAAEYIVNADFMTGREEHPEYEVCVYAFVHVDECVCVCLFVLFVYARVCVLCVLCVSVCIYVFCLCLLPVRSYFLVGNFTRG